MRTLLDPLASLVFPEFCRVCDGLIESLSFGVACQNCWEKGRVIGPDSPHCVKCGFLLVGGRPGGQVHCGRCNDHFYDIARSAGVYEFALAATVLNLKKVPNIPTKAERALAAALSNIELNKDSLVIPVPLSNKRLVERGFNQAALLASLVARTARLKLDGHSLTRIRDTPMHRGSMDRKAREASVKGAFAVVRPALIKDRHIVLVDDVFTSGASVSHCALTLKKNGAASVTVLTLARAVS